MQFVCVPGSPVHNSAGVVLNTLKLVPMPAGLCGGSDEASEVSGKPMNIALDGNMETTLSLHHVYIAPFPCLQFLSSYLS